MVESNSNLYAEGENLYHRESCLGYSVEDVSNTLHVQIVIKYVLFIGDSKKAMSKCTSEICIGGHNIFVLQKTCEVSS